MHELILPNTHKKKSAFRRSLFMVPSYFFFLDISVLCKLEDRLNLTHKRNTKHFLDTKIDEAVLCYVPSCGM